MQGEEQAEGPLRHETGTVMCSVEEASSTERAAVIGEAERAAMSRSATCTVEERAPPA